MKRPPRPLPRTPSPDGTDYPPSRGRTGETMKGQTVSRHSEGGGGDEEAPYTPTTPLGSIQNSTMGRRPTLSRPERQRSTRRRPMLRALSAGPPAARAGATTNRVAIAPDTTKPGELIQKETDTCSEVWIWSARAITCCFWPWCLKKLGKKEGAVQQAWREKLALCLIIVALCGAVGFLTFGLLPVLCPSSDSIVDQHPIFNETSHLMSPPPSIDNDGPGVVINGFEFAFKGVQNNLGWFGRIILTDDWRGTDISKLFPPNLDNCPANLRRTAQFDCSIPNPISPSRGGLPGPGLGCANPDWIFPYNIRKRKRTVDWEELSNHTQAPHMLVVYNNMVVNLTQVFTTPAATGLNLSATTTAFLQQHLGKDATYAAHSKPEVSEALRCLVAKYQVAYIGSETTGCMAANVIQTMSLIVILGVVMVRFLMALYFYWCMSPNITKPRRGKTKLRSLPTKSRFSATIREFATPNSLDRERDMYAILLVTCYSEGKDGIRTTLDSLALTDYPDDKKLLFVVADGLITGTGNEKSTPDIIRDMIVEDPELPAPEPKSYVAIADGTKQHNRAKVHAGTYHVEGRSVPIILVAKCGTDAEADSKKPGNRGKRDSQLVVMNFLSRVMFDDRMTPLDYELFYRIQHVAKITAEQYEVVLMVDADTKVARNSLEHMVNAMKNDVSIMGLCGETRIANKTASWTSAMQVFEYYISHHLGKAFESVFGGVTCLPGCFCMYRIKAPKGAHGSWVPVLVNPDIVDEYSENVVDTLHKKNLLLLGEDRFLTTLMLRNFPKRKMIFVPQAVCWTMAPEQFKVLLSQRRRWINSTIHNLMELVLVKDLCGIFCFSMQFVVLLELIGTVVLPAAISFTLYLIISAIATQTVELIPFLLLGAILGLPGFFIIITTRKLVYVGYMFIYLLSLPIWNFVLPAYAFWHFDDFSWGETRKVEGEKKEKTHHGNREGQFESGAVVLKRWAEWERENHPSRPPSEYKFPTPIAVYPRSNRASIVTLPPADHVQPPFAVDPSVVSDASYPPSNVIMPPPPGMYRASVGAFPPPMGPIRFTPNPYMPHGGPFPPFVPQNGELAPMLVAPHTLGVLPGASASQVSNSSLDPLLPDKGKRRGSVSQTTLSSSPSGGNGGSEGGGYRYSHSVGDDESPGEGTTSAVAHPQRNGSGSSSGAGSNSAAGSSGAASTPSTGKGRLVAPDIRIEEVPAVDYR